jgi:signal transduction histidine kinase
LWIGTGEGVVRYCAGKASWFGSKTTPPLADVRAVVEDQHGAVWARMLGGGLARLQGGQITRFTKKDGLSSDFIQCLYPDVDGTLWIGTSDAGLIRRRQGRFAVIDRQQGLPSSAICDIQDDEAGYFWISSHAGIIRVEKRELNRCADGKLSEVHFLSYGISDGLPTLECSGGLQPAGCRTADGHLWFPTTKGLVTVDPRRVPTNALPPPVIIEELRVDDELHDPTPRILQPSVNASPSSPLVLPPGRHRLEFHYTGLSFVGPEKVRFKHRLEGLDQRWIDAGTRRTANYSYLPPGDYRFRVIACNNDGLWNEQGATFGFMVSPHFWQTVWFRLLVGAAVIAASGACVWFDTRRRMRRKLERTEQLRALEQERARIAKDIHDDLGSNLTLITMLSESARRQSGVPAPVSAALDQIRGTARELTRAMAEVVWAINPRHDTLDSLVNYLQKYGQDFLKSAGIRCRLDLPLQLPSGALTAEVRHNVFLAFKEILNNTAKHSRASEVQITLLLHLGGFTLTVRDDGRGFEAASSVRAGNGLENMRQRLAQVRGRCEIESHPGEGTRVTLYLPMA